MGAIVDKIKDLINKWKGRVDKVDVILDSTLANMKEMAEAIELMKQNMEESRKIIDSVLKTQEEIKVRLQEFDGMLFKMKKSFWYGIFFGKD